MRRRNMSVAVALALAALSAGLPGQGSWSQTPITGAMPVRAGHAAVYELSRSRLLTFGGFDATNVPQATTSQFDGVHWAPVATPATPAPPPRVGHAMAYDITRDRIVLFGGIAAIIGAPMGDTWEFDGAQWVQRFPAHAPASRMDHAMAYDVVSQRTMLFGGRNNGQSLHGDTWLWDGADWTAWSPAATTGPSPRRGHAMSCDWNRGSTVLFGGFDGSVLGDTWEWNGAAWSQTAVGPAPSARSNHAMAYDFARAVTVLQGGAPNGAETWEWDGTSWTQHGSTGLAVSDHVLVFDAQLQRTTLFGGRGVVPGTFHDEVETYGEAVQGSFETLGVSCPGSSGTAQLVGVSSPSPGPTIGETSIVQVRQAWFHAFFVFGWSESFDGGTPLPHDLAAYGMPGCTLQVSRDAIASAPSHNGTATMSMPIPNNPFLVGLSYFIQGLALDLGANAGGFTTTNRIEVTVGRN